jgi:hypothetical protein
MSKAKAAGVTRRRTVRRKTHCSASIRIRRNVIRGKVKATVLVYGSMFLLEIRGNLLEHCNDHCLGVAAHSV